ncbi:phage tail protein [Clostridium botulinum]|uniref:phage tail protein n=1 Tax=Clostridium botulinum TaxID=1491 RepID=UPI000957B5AC|nr:phage tail protein [Clostridium botulinum]APU60249.1 phage tail-collar fiber family protein [Clostridium botulinum]
MEQFYTLLTDIGKAKIANATALQKKLELSKIVLGDSKGSYYGPTEQQTQLKNKVWEGEITDKFIDKDNPNWIVVQTIIPSQIGGFTIREAGVVDSEGDLVLVAKYPETYKPKVENGSTKDITINLILEVSNVENVTLKVDPTIIFATKKDIENVKKEVAENTLSKEDIQTTIENIKASDIKTSSGATVETQLADITTDNKRLTKDKTITGAINELFTNANNGKNLISSVVGSPLLATDTFQQQHDKIQTLKNTFATNLTAKEQPSAGNETLLNLINKVANINVGKKYAKGELTEVEFTENYIISYLDFKPSIILISGWENRSPNYVDFTINMIYTSDGFICGGQHTYDQLKGSTLLVRAGAGSGNNFQFSTNFTDDITATNNGFVIKQSSFLQYIHSNFKWVAIE